MPIIGSPNFMMHGRLASGSDVRGETPNRGGSSSRLRYRYATMLMARSCAVWPGEVNGPHPDGFDTRGDL